MIHAAILLANFLVTGIILFLGSAMTYTIWKDRGLEFEFEEVTISALVGVVIPFLAFLLPLTEMVTLVFH